VEEEDAAPWFRLQASRRGSGREAFGNDEGALREGLGWVCAREERGGAALVGARFEQERSKVDSMRRNTVECNARLIAILSKNVLLLLPRKNRHALP
jgi:hypothetical protein